jgi:hypothetical protein
VASDDIRENHPELGGEALRPYFRREDKQLIPDGRFRASPAHRSSRIALDALVAPLTDWSQLSQLTAGLASEPLAPELLAPAGDDAAFVPPMDPRWREAWVLTERLLLALRDECLQRQIPLMVVGVTYGPQVHPDPATRDELARRLGVSDLLYPEERLAPFLVGNRVPFMPLAPFFQRHATERHVVLHGFARDGTLGRGPWNPDAHALAAKLMSPWIAQELTRRGK